MCGYPLRRQVLFRHTDVVWSATAYPRSGRLRSLTEDNSGLPIKGCWKVILGHEMDWSIIERCGRRRLY